MRSPADAFPAAEAAEGTADAFPAAEAAEGTADAFCAAEAAEGTADAFCAAKAAGSSTGTAGVLLAAGAGTRMGRPKALVRFAGELLVERGIRLLIDGGLAPVVVVLGAGDVGAAADLSGAVVVENPDWPSGVGSSLRAGLAALPASATGALITLVDQPLISPVAIRRVAAAAGPAATATYGGVPGHPVLLRRPAWEEVAASAIGDVGARTYLRAHADQVVRVPCDDAGSPADVDTPADLAAIS